MDPVLFKVLLHLGDVVRAGRDLERMIADLVKKVPAQADIDAFLVDLEKILGDGLINIPGVPSDQLVQILGGIKKA